MGKSRKRVRPGKNHSTGKKTVARIKKNLEILNRLAKKF